MHDKTHEHAPTEGDLDDVVPFLDGLPRSYPALFIRKHSAAWLLRNRERNGLAPLVHFVGRQAFISKREFANWFRSRPSCVPRERR